MGTPLVIESPDSPSFVPYGKLLKGDFSDVVAYLQEKTPLPEKGNLYVRDEEALSHVPSVSRIKEEAFPNADMECGYCNGFNTKLNCLESHACPEVDVAADDLVLLLATPMDIEDGKISSSKVKAFRLKKGQAVLLYPFIFHFSPCRQGESFRCGIFLTQGTNADLKEPSADPRLWKVNKWLYAHPESNQAKLGAYLGIEGDNLEIVP